MVKSVITYLYELSSRALTESDKQVGSSFIQSRFESFT